MPKSTIDLPSLLTLRSAKPFRPFTFQLKTGDRLDVLEATRFCTNGRGVLMFGPSGSIERFSLKDVTDVRELDANELATHIEAGHFRR